MCLGIPGQLVEIPDPADHRAIADVAGARREVNIGLVAGDEGGVVVGDWVLIHVGFAMAKIDPDEAARTLELLRSFDDVFEEELAQFRGSDRPE
jgi:hydrogenase expression/formation protein HypC